jgi:hypothetical protein
MVMSEPVFTTLALGALLLIELCARRRMGRSAAVVLGGILTLATFTRTIGIALWPAAVVRLVRVNIRDLAGLAIGSAALLAAVVVLTPVGIGNLYPHGYTAELQEGWPGMSQGTPEPIETVPEQVMRVVAEYTMREIRGALIPFGGGDRERAVGMRLGIDAGPEIVGLLVTAVTALGAWQCVRTAALAPAALLFELSYLAILFGWVWHSARYLYPIQPLLSFQLLFGIWWLANWAVGVRRPQAAGRAATGVVIVVSALLIVASAWKSLDTGDSRRFTRDLVADTSWIAANSAPNAIVMARYPASIHLYAKRQTEPLPAVKSAAELDEVLIRRKVDYILIGPELLWQFDAAFRYSDEDAGLLVIVAAMADAGRLELVYASDPQRKILVYKVNKASGNGGPQIN